MTAWRLACCFALLVWQQTTPVSQAPDPAWPPAGVSGIHGVDVPPRLVRERKPEYTAEAMRARIQGVVRLACVVMADGSVGDIRVTNSLDKTFGLDDQAIAALKQWRFSPAMKAGSPVPVVVDVELTFTLRNGRSPAAALTWPEGFAATLDEATKQAEWTDETFEVLNLRIKISYPAGWILTKSANERAMIQLMKAGEATLLTIGPPKPSLQSMDRVLTAEELGRVAERMASGLAGQGMQVESLGFGQAPAASHIWAWHAWKMVSFATPNMSAIGGAAIRQLYDGGRIWSFEGTAGNSAFSIACLAGIPRRLSDTERASFVTSRAATFGEILRRMSITTTP